MLGVAGRILIQSIALSKHLATNIDALVYNPGCGLTFGELDAEATHTVKVFPKYDFATFA